MTAPTDTAVEVVHDEPDTGEMRVRFPVVVIEGVETSDGRYLNAGSLTHRALPLSLLACPESAHGGDDPSAAVVIGRIDTLTRTPGPDVLSPRSGEPYPEGTFVWSGEGAVDAHHPVAGLVRRRFLRGVSVDLAGMDVELIGEDEALADAEHPRRRMIAHAAEIAAVTLVPIPAFSDAYVELADETAPPEVVPLDEIPEGLVASVSPAWRSFEVGDYAVAETGATYVEQMRDRIGAELGDDEISGWGDNTDLLLDLYTLLAFTSGAGVTSQQVHDAWSVAIQRTDPGHRSLVPFDELAPDVQAMDDKYRDAIAAAVASETNSEIPEEEAPAMATEDVPDDAEPEPADEVGMPDAPQSCEMCNEPAVRSLLFSDGAGDRYAAACALHVEDTRAKIAGLGFEVSQEAEIRAVEPG